LQTLAEETGGRSFYPYHVDDLDQSFQDIGEELRNQYSLAYNPSNHGIDGKYHKIKIEMPDRKGYQARARRGYYARSNNDLGPKPAGTVK
jgi:Ca-activated chloride channel family protein